MMIFEYLFSTIAHQSIDTLIISAIQQLTSPFHVNSPVNIQFIPMN